MSARGSRLPLLGLLFLGALAISAFTLFRGGAEFDEGLILQAAQRVAAGQAPYSDFSWPYGPAHPYLLGALSDLFGPSLIGWRILRSLVDAGVAVTVFALATRAGAPRPLALAGWLAAACAMAQPTSATPLAPALMFALLAILVGTGPRTSLRALAGAALLTALAAAWRLDVAVYGGAGVLIGLLLGRGTLAERARDTATYASIAVTLTLLAYLPALIDTGPSDLYESLLGASLRERDYWTLPFPISFDGGFALWPPGTLAEDTKDLLGFYAPLLALIGFALAAARALARRDDPARGQTVALLVLGVGLVAYLVSRTDEFHATPLVVVLAALVPPALSPFRPRVLAGGLAAAFGLLLLLGVVNRLSALVQPPELVAIDLPAADGAKAPPAEARALEGMVALVHRAARPGEPIYTITRRSDLVRFNQPLVYVLADRPNPTRREYGIQTSDAAQRRLVARLEETRPRAIVRWRGRATVVREPNLRGRPTGSRVLDRWVADRYRLLGRSGAYDVLVPRAPG